MQILNHTPYLAELSFASDKHSLDYWVIVIKATFEVRHKNVVVLAEEQVPFKYSDEYYGDPDNTSIRYPCDFVISKPFTDVILNGSAYSSGGKPVKQVSVSLEVDGRLKTLNVFGDRYYRRSLFGMRPSSPEMFSHMPLRYERSYGGKDISHKNQQYHSTELRNPVGTGFRANKSNKPILGSALANIESAENAKNYPVGLGAIGPGWMPRIKYAGTYDKEWLEKRYPFLPLDFDEKFHQSAPPDQTFPHFRGGEHIVCKNLNPNGNWSFALPSFHDSIGFVFRNSFVELVPTLDTVIIEPDLYRIILVWRAKTPVGKRAHDLQNVIAGGITPAKRRAAKNGKPIFRSINEQIEWQQLISAEYY
jgi:hypothetical protein